MSDTAHQWVVPVTVPITAEQAAAAAAGHALPVDPGPVLGVGRPLCEVCRAPYGSAQAALPCPGAA